MIRTEKIAVTTTGNNGAATGTGYSSHALNGELQAICVDWGATAPATSDIDIVVEADDNHPQVTLYDKDDSSTDAWVYPVVQRTPRRAPRWMRSTRQSRWPAGSK